MWGLKYLRGCLKSNFEKFVFKKVLYVSDYFLGLGYSSKEIMFNFKLMGVG